MAVSNNWKNLRDFLRKSYNREVNEWFRDINDPVPDNTAPRNQAKRACLILPKETQNSALLKVLNFRFVVQRTHLRPHVFGTPIGTVNAQRKYRPQIVFQFLEDVDDIVAGYDRIDSKISYRLMNETSDTITVSELTAIATRIKASFGIGDGFIWRKGKDLASYTDWDKGYQLQLLVRNKTDAREIVTLILGTNGDRPIWSKFNYKENEEPTTAYPTIPPTQRILGQTYRESRIRPIASVRFQYAYCSIWGKPQSVILYDRSFTYLNTLVED